MAQDARLLAVRIRLGQPGLARDYIAQMQRAIVGIEIVVEAVLAN